MKNILNTAVATLIVFCSASVFASSYQESKLANCGGFDLIASTVESQQMDGSLASTTNHILRYNTGEEKSAEKIQAEDLDQWVTVLSADSSLVVSKTLQDGRMQFSWSIVKDGKVTFSKACNQSDIILY